MHLIRGLHNLRPQHHGCVATIGNFDGVHLGHREILSQLDRAAKRLGVPSVVIVFEPQPREFFTPDSAPGRLSRFSEKLTLLSGFADTVLCLPFNETLRAMSAQAFVDQVLVNGLGIQHLVVGDDFCFGADRAGDYALLQQAGQKQGFTVERADSFEVLGQRVSSTRVRDAVAEGNFALAEQLLGYPYAMTGRVSHGLALGRTLGFPTANIHLHRQVSPLHGVYRVKVQLASGEWKQGVCNIGKRPTVNRRFAQDVRLEVHLFDYSGDLYRQRLQVVFLDKLRDEKKFSGLDELQRQIAADIVEARARITREASAL